jgi:uncharacterized phage-associated protein
VALTYREDKATQAAAFLLARHGGRMNHMKLIKLLYLVDREALLRWGRPVTFDWYYSLQHGPILSFTLNRINEDPEPANPTYWHRFISERRVHEVELLRDAPVDELSPAEVALLNDVFERLGHLTQWDLRDLSHSLPEWRDPQGSRLPIEVGDILRAGRIPADQAQEILDALEAESAAERILQ